jgi:hypothetical protein
MRSVNKQKSAWLARGRQKPFLVMDTGIRDSIRSYNPMAAVKLQDAQFPRESSPYLILDENDHGPFTKTAGKQTGAANKALKLLPCRQTLSN